MKEEEKKDAAVQAEEKKEERKIPFVGHLRVGNFKIWKSSIRLSANDVSTADERSEAAKRGKRVKVPQKSLAVIHISDLGNIWKVQIPQTYLAFAMIEQCVADGNYEFLQTFIANTNFVSAISNGFYQRAVALCGHCYMHPEILTAEYKPEQGPSHADLMREFENIRTSFLHWYKAAMEEERARRVESEEQVLKEDETAEKAIEITMRPVEDDGGRSNPPTRA